MFVTTPLVAGMTEEALRKLFSDVSYDAGNQVAKTDADLIYIVRENQGVQSEDDR